MRCDFAVIVISHGDENFSTEKVLRNSGYDGKLFVVVDDEDPKLKEYQKKYGKSCHVFHKQEWFDTFDNSDEPRNISTFARNECFKLADENGIKIFLLIDDDLKGFTWRYEENGKLVGMKVKNISRLFNIVCEWFDDSSISCVGFSNAADYIGGVIQEGKRNVMSGFFLRTSEPFVWRARACTDIIAAVAESRKGRAWLKLPQIQGAYDVWTAKKRSKKKEGNIAAYEKYGAYHMRFFQVMAFPDCSVIRVEGDSIDWSVSNRNAYPLIVSESVKK